MLSYDGGVVMGKLEKEAIVMRVDETHAIRFDKYECPIHGIHNAHLIIQRGDVPEKYVGRWCLLCMIDGYNALRMEVSDGNV